MLPFGGMSSRRPFQSDCPVSVACLSLGSYSWCFVVDHDAEPEVWESVGRETAENAVLPSYKADLRDLARDRTSESSSCRRCRRCSGLRGVDDPRCNKLAGYALRLKRVARQAAVIKQFACDHHNIFHKIDVVKLLIHNGLRAHL